jgi:hypothetical protein
MSAPMVRLDRAFACVVRKKNSAECAAETPQNSRTVIPTTELAAAWRM